MKLQQLLLNAARPKPLLVAFFSMVGMLSPNLAAQQQSFRTAADNSTARLFVGTRENPRSFGMGVARASGEANINTNNLEESTFNFIVYSGAEAATNDPDSQALAGDQPVISFQSQRVTEKKDGSLEIDGQLTVTQAVRDPQVSTGEDYSGPTYGAPRLVRASHPATFVLAAWTDEPGDQAPAITSEVRLLTAQQALPASGLVLTATSTVNGEAYPELATSIAETAWPAVTSNVQCTISSSVGEDYSGPQCSEDIVQPLSPPALPIQVGEGYSGLQVRQPTGSQITIDIALVMKTNNTGNPATSQTQPEPMGKSVTNAPQSAAR